jgi:transcriptional regulator with XRE-family HTH domain
MTDGQGYFAERLKSLRAGAGLSQTDLAERAGLGVSTLRHFEYGLKEPTFATLVKLARGLGVSLAAFDPPPDPGPARKRRKGG